MIISIEEKLKQIQELHADTKVSFERRSELMDWTKSLFRKYKGIVSGIGTDNQYEAVTLPSWVSDSKYKELREAPVVFPPMLKEGSYLIDLLDTSIKCLSVYRNIRTEQIFILKRWLSDRINDPSELQKLSGDIINEINNDRMRALMSINLGQERTSAVADFSSVYGSLRELKACVTKYDNLVSMLKDIDMKALLQEMDEVSNMVTTLLTTADAYTEYEIGRGQAVKLSEALTNIALAGQVIAIINTVVLTTGQALSETKYK